MKKHIYLIVLLLFSQIALYAQTLSSENFIYTEVPQKPVQSANYGSLPASEKQKSVTYFDGLGRPMQTIAIGQGGNKLNTNLLDWKNNWTLGSGSVPYFASNGASSENQRVDGVTPFGTTDRLWRCVNDAASDPDGGWNSGGIPVDKTHAYRYAVWVKRTGGQNGTTYHGVQNVLNLSGTANGNPYFWYGNLPQLDTWYLMVGMIHPAGYTGGYSGISGVYDTSGNKVLSGTDFKWDTSTSIPYFRSYLFYSTDVNVSQYFYSPIVQKVDGSDASIMGLVKGVEADDIITPVVYDNFGRQDKDYLPYTSGSTGSYRPNALTEVGSFYNTSAYENTTNPFSQKEFEASPLNRVLQQAAPGAAWSLPSTHTIKMDYQTNTATEVKLFQVVTTFTSGLYNPTLTQTTTYGAGQLYKNITKDENWATSDGKNKTTEEFKDKEGRVVLKRTYSNYVNALGSITASEVAHDTYYVYDIYGNLTYVIPPLANGAFDTTTLNNLCYQYKYDYRNRLVEKKLPGKDWEFIVYDKLDRVVLTQDANLKAQSKWLFTKYDVFNRPVYTGEYINTANRDALQTQVSAGTTLSEQRQGVTIIGDSSGYYSNLAIPNTDITLYTVNYYDDYGFDLAGGVSETAGGITPITNAKGLATGSRVRTLGTSQWTTNVQYYDAKGRQIYAYSKNDYLGTVDKIKSTLDFTGKATQTETRHKKGTNPELVLVDSFEYDHAGRLLTQKQAINGSTQEIIASNNYDSLGQLVSKGVGGKTTQNRLQNVDYKYNIRGWLKNINDTNTIGNDLFSFAINYNTPTDASKALYNGNISQTFWRTANSDASLKNYLYSYDALNRLTLAVDNQSRYKEQLGYDANGNITFLQRDGNTVAGTQNYGAIDNLAYVYTGNQLYKVTDATLNTEGFNNGTSGTSNDYTYDANGNMKKDLNKGITTDIAYNYLNLPTQVTIDGQNINYTYDATGKKLRKLVNGTTTDYAGGFQYENNVLQFFPTAEGYVDHNAGNYSYVYQYKDHLGNVRLAYKDSNNDGVVTTTEILSEDNYYPFGLKHKGYNSTVVNSNNKYKYNGKELQDELGLNMYDYGNRNYDASIARFLNIDRFAEKYHHLNPYQYGANNPILFNDIKGDSILIYSKQDKTNVLYENGNLYSKNSKTGKWDNYNGKNVKVDKNGNKSIGGYLGKVTVALDKIRSGNAGNELVGELQKNSKFITIGEGSNSSGGISGRVSWDPSNTTGGPNEIGSNSRPSYIGLTHELGHAFDGLDGVIDNTLLGALGMGTFAEYESMHWENRVRGENGLPLRTHYSNDANGNALGQAINSNGSSTRYFQQQTMPTTHLQTNYSSSGMQIVPVSGTTTTVIPFKYK
jgi:RHS repeat-associated protein